ncbi:MAG: hypothetical protein IIW02_05970 [Clostridia bacterium]|nr:hypothetical protein [Clostridia bacterium]
MKIRTLLFTMLFIIAFSVIFLTTFSVYATAAIPATEAETNSETGRVALYKGGNSAHNMSAEDIIASHFSIAGDATFVGVCCPSWSDSVGDMRVELYAFDTDYNKTIAGDPIATNMFENFDDNDFIGFSFEESDPLKAGEYVIRLLDAFDAGGTGVGVWKHGDHPGQELYQNDEYIPDSSLKIGVTFITPPEGEIYGKLTGYSTNDIEINKVPNLDNMLIFDSEDMLELVTGGLGCQDISIEDGHLHINVTATNDSQITIVLPYWADDSVYCDESKAMLVKFRKSEGSPDSGEVFFSTSLFAGPTAGGSVTADYEDTTEWQYAVFNFATNTKYTQEGAILNMFRYDIFASENKDAIFDIEYILFFDNKESALQWDGNFDAIATPVPTEKPVTPTPQATQKPTQKPVTQAPEITNEPTDVKKEKGGCGSSVMLAHAMIIVGAAMIIRRKK